MSNILGKIQNRFDLFICFNSLKMSEVNTIFARILGLNYASTPITLRSIVSPRAFIISVTMIYSLMYGMISFLVNDTEDGFIEKVFVTNSLLIIDFKLWTLLYFAKDIQEVNNLITLDLFQHIEDDAKFVEAFKKAAHNAKRLSYLIFFGLLIVVCRFSLSRFLKDTSFRNPMEYLGNVLFDDIICSYWVNSLYQLWVELVAILVIVCFDGILLMYLIVLAKHLDIILLKLDSISSQFNIKSSGRKKAMQMTEEESLSLHECLIQVHRHYVSVIR